VLSLLTYVVIGFAALLTVYAGAMFAFHRSRPAMLDVCAWVLETAFVVRFVAGVGVLLRGEKAAEPAPYLGYLIACICIMPVAMSALREDREPWSSAVVAVAALALTVIGIRLQKTWGHG
jgi:hypothetical protein